MYMASLVYIISLLCYITYSLKLFKWQISFTGIWFLWLSVGIKAGCDINLASNVLLVRPEKVLALLIPAILSQTAHL